MVIKLANIVEVNTTNDDVAHARIYISSMQRNKETARGLFPDNEYYEMEVGEILWNIKVQKQ